MTAKFREFIYVHFSWVGWGHTRSNLEMSFRGVSFLPEASFGLRAVSSPASVCLCVRVCINHLRVRTRTHHPVKLESPNLAYRCKRPWLRYLLFWGVIDLDLQGQI